MTSAGARLSFLLFAGLALAPAAWAGDALTETLESENKRGTVAEKRGPTKTATEATIDGVLLKGCEDAEVKGRCETFFYIVLPQQLDALMSGGAPMDEERCRELGAPMGCAKSVQILPRQGSGLNLAKHVNKRVSVTGVIFEHETPHHHRPAVMTVDRVTRLPSAR